MTFNPTSYSNFQEYIYRKQSYTIFEVAEILDVCDKTVRNKINRGDIQALKIGGSLRVPNYSVDSYYHECLSFNPYQDE